MTSFPLKSLGQTLAILRARRGPASSLPEGADHLAEFTGFGSNPGALVGRTFIPSGLQPGAPLVVVLHGCTQSAVAYDHGSGWSALAENAGFALLFPEQTRSKNPNLCFNWFSPAEVARGKGEAASIHQMITTMIERHGVDRSRIFITGLSAGGAMAASMLATYPETFAAGAIIAGIPHGVAKSMPQAFSVMRGKLPGDSSVQLALSSASMHRGPWPRISIWQGSADATVAPTNAAALLAQWRSAHGAEPAPDVEATVHGARHRSWNGRQAGSVLELWDIPGMGHGTPIAPGKDGLGHAGPFMLDVGISSTREIARFFGISRQFAAAPPEKGVSAAKPLRLIPEIVQQAEEARTVTPEPSTDAEPAFADTASPVGAYVTEVIERSLPGRTDLPAYIKSVISNALQKAGLR